MIRLLSLVPAVYRDNAAMGVCFIDAESIAKTRPGAFRSSTASVASGVISRDPKPVPPVVIIRWLSSETQSSKASFIAE